MTPLTRAQCARCQQKAAAAASASASAPRKNRVAGVVQFFTSPCWSPLSFPRPQTSRGGSSTDSGVNIQLFELECLSTMLMCSGENRSPRRSPSSANQATERARLEPCCWCNKSVPGQHRSTASGSQGAAECCEYKYCPLDFHRSVRKPDLVWDTSSLRLF